MQIYTLGYQGLNSQFYSQALVNAGVSLVIDVRENPWSYRSEYIGAILKRELAEAGIDYEHWRALGNPASIRKTAKTPAQCLRRYAAHLARLPQVTDLLAERFFLEWNNGRRICLTCFEKDVDGCHRSIIIAELLRRQPEIIPINLCPEPPPRSAPRRATTKQLILSPSFP